MNKYEMPDLQIEVFEVEDIITTSGAYTGGSGNETTPYGF